MAQKVVLVTGGTGLVGKAIESVIQEESPSDEKWIFVGSREANLWYVRNGYLIRRWNEKINWLSVI